MPLNANALVTLPAAKTFIQPGGMGPADDAALEDVINRVSAAIERHCNRPLARATHTVALRGSCARELFLRHTPIATDQTVSVSMAYATTLTVWRSAGDGDPSTYDVVLASSCDDQHFTPDHLFRSAGWSGAGTPYDIVVSYTGGWATVPGDLEEAALETVKKVWTDQTKGVQDVTGIDYGGSSTSMTGTFGQAGGLNYGAFPQRAFQILQRYRHMVVI